MADEDERGVSTLELFFDLVFVFGITQVTAYLADNPSPIGFVEGFLLLFLLWWAWTGFTWTGSAVDIGASGVRLVIFAVMAGLLVVAIGMPEWFHDAPDGLAGVLDAPVVVALAYAAVRIGHLFLYAIAGRGTPGLPRAVVRFGSAVGVAVVLVVTGAVVGGVWQVALVTLAVVLDYSGGLLGGGEGWYLNLRHFAERHGLIVIIALGESIVAVGVGASGLPLSWPLVLVAALGLGVAARLWIIYFDPFADKLEDAVGGFTGSAQVRRARDVYSYGHSLIVAGIVLIALGLKKTMFTVGEYGLSKPLAFYAAAAFCAGIALFLLARQAILRRAACAWEWRTVGAAVAALVAIPVAVAVPASLTLVGGIALLMIAGRHPHPADSAGQTSSDTGTLDS